MYTRSKSGLVVGMVLILFGAWFLAVQFVPDLRAWSSGNWPLSIIAVGVLLFLVGVVTGAYGMSVPAAIVGGIGGLLYWQNATGDWESWAYAWSLIPGFVGVGVLLTGLFERSREALTGSVVLIFISLVLYSIFGSFLGAPNAILQYWPILIIGLGFWIMLRTFFRKSSIEQISESEEL